MPIGCQLWSGFEERESIAGKLVYPLKALIVVGRKHDPHPKGQDHIVPMKATTVTQDNREPPSLLILTRK